jgi:predicted kinase
MKSKAVGTLYAMTGGNGAGKTTHALGLAKEQGAKFFSLDRTIKDFNQPIQSYEDYMSYHQRAIDRISSEAVEILQSGRSVVLDFGGGLATRPWLKQIANQASAKVEVRHLEVSLEERRRRVQKRNQEKNSDVYHFHMSDAEFDRQNKEESSPPPEEDGIQVVRINNR